MVSPLLQAENLTLHYTRPEGLVRAVDGLSFSIMMGETFGLVGESGCGKTSAALMLLRLLPGNAVIARGHIWFSGVDLLALPEREMHRYRWKHIAMVFQEAMSAFNPVYRVGDQIAEAIRIHNRHLSSQQVQERVFEMVSMVGLDPLFANRYPHELSGGMRQRAMIAMALSCQPSLIIADEPTTALDVIVQDRILQRLQELRATLGMSILYISHDIAIVAEICSRIGVMYAGQMVEIANTGDLLTFPRHPYTAALTAAFPSITGPKSLPEPLPGEPPSLVSPPPGCRFHPRCNKATRVCREEQPPMQVFEGIHHAACWHPLEEPLSP
nr:ABC transporter ATP-binding protein [Anaerolineae bacterium]